MINYVFYNKFAQKSQHRIFFYEFTILKLCIDYEDFILQLHAEMSYYWEKRKKHEFPGQDVPIGRYACVPFGRYSTNRSISYTVMWVVGSNPTLGAYFLPSLLQWCRKWLPIGSRLKSKGERSVVIQCDGLTRPPC